MRHLLADSSSSSSSQEKIGALLLGGYVVCCNCSGESSLTLEVMSDGLCWCYVLQPTAEVG